MFTCGAADLTIAADIACGNVAFSDFVKDSESESAKLFENTLPKAVGKVEFSDFVIESESEFEKSVDRDFDSEVDIAVERPVERFVARPVDKSRENLSMICGNFNNGSSARARPPFPISYVTVVFAVPSFKA